MSPTTDREVNSVVFTEMRDHEPIPPLQEEEDGMEEYQEQSTLCFCLCTKNLKALWGLFLINTTFAVCQLVAAIAANSVSMMSDSGSMLVDSFSYMVAIGTERRKIKHGLEASKLIEALCSLISVGLLITVTAVTMSDAIHRLEHLEEDDEDEVAGQLVVLFSGLNLLMDVFMCGNYWYQLQGGGSNAKQLNMVAAFVHLFADTMRSLTGVVAGALEMENKQDSVKIDAFATFIVCFAILLAAAFVLFEAIMQFRSVFKEGRSGAGEVLVSSEMIHV
ncbi:hypothetical protein BASA81_007134 [Batrachochytrium salamandrivorans]|nr:hypothetical protein BASA81_007134 [Batrachochytrium salamandrivorans]